MSLITAIVVTYNSEQEVGRCLDSLEGKADVVVVDNASTDGTVGVVRLRPWVKLIANQVNYGFAGGVNQGFEAMESPLVLILNPDAEVLTDLTPLATACETHGVSAGLLVEEDGRPQVGFTIRRFPTTAVLAFESLGINRLWPGNPVNRRYRYLDREVTREGLVEQPAGAFLMVRRDVFQGLGGFDESFQPVWFEDVDFLKRAAYAGFPSYFVPQVKACHVGGHSVNRLSGKSRKQFWYASLLRYAVKHFNSMQFRVVCASVAIGCAVKAVPGIFWGSHRSVYRGVIQSALKGLCTARLYTQGVPETSWRKGDAEAVASHPVQR